MNIKYSGPVKVLADLDLDARLAAAMAKAGVDAKVRLEPAFIHQSHSDVSGLKVIAQDDDIRHRAAAWVNKALIAAGVKQWSTGHGLAPIPMGDPEILNTRSYGEDITLICLIACSIGD